MDPRDRSKNSPSSAIAKNTRGDASMLPFSELNEEIITNTETRTTPARPNSAIIVSAATSGDLSDGLDRHDVEVGDVGQHVDADDRQRAEDDGARQVALRVLHFAGGEREVGPAVVGPEDADEREARCCRPRSTRPRRRGVEVRDGRAVAAAERERRSRPAAQRRELGRGRPADDGRADVGAADVGAGGEGDGGGRQAAGRERMRRPDRRRKCGAGIRRTRSTCRRGRWRGSAPARTSRTERPPAGPSLLAGRRRSRRSPAAAGRSSASESAPHSVMRPPSDPDARASRSGSGTAWRCRPATGRCPSRS